jgi:hypothetical protein
MLEPIGAPRLACTKLAPSGRLHRHRRASGGAGARGVPGVTHRAGAWLVASAATLAGCLDTVEPGAYAPDDPDAGSDTSSPGPSSATRSGDPDAGSLSGFPSGSPSRSDASADAQTQRQKSAQSSAPCDLTGRWLVALRTMTDALGTSEANHEWYYYELTQSGTQVTVSRGLVCGKNTRALSALSGNADLPKTWPAMMAKMSDTGRKGSSAPASGGCQVSFEAHYEVMGATESYYSDPSHALPTVSEQASGSTPGWEDWDQDGQPGYTLNISGLATGQIYMADRAKYALSGAIAASASPFDLAVDWSSEQDVLGVNGPSILSETAAATKDGDPAQHFATFVRLTDTQATGSDDAMCSAIRTLAPMLAPKACN